MNIIQIAYNWDDESGGISLSIDNFAQALHSSVISFTKENGGNYKAGATANQLHIPYSECAVNRYAYTWSSIKKRAEQVASSADIIICHGLYRYHIDWAIQIANKYNIPYIIVPHGSLDPYVFTYRSIYKKIWLALKGRKHFKNAGSIIFATEKEKNKAQLVISSDRSSVVHWPVDRIDTENSVEVKARIRKELDIPINAKVLLYIGRIHPMKRPIETINAVMSSNRDNIYLLMIGPDSDVLSIADCVEYCNKNNFKNIRFIKPVFGNEKYDYFMSADAFVSFSFRENFGYTVAEALSTGVPVILSPGNDLSNEIGHLNCGWLLEDDTAESRSKSISEFAATSSEQLIEMGHRGQQWTRNELSFEVYQAKINSIVSQILANLNAKPL